MKEEAQTEMHDKVCMVTGATSGIGLATAEELAKMGATVILVGRDRLKSERTVQRIQDRTSNPKIGYLLADLSSQSDIRHLAQDFKNQYQELHVLVNNVGATFGRRLVTVDGIEMTFALNHLSYFYLTHLLLNSLIASSPSRIINVSSFSHRMGLIRFNDIQWQRGYIGWMVYNQSKLANLLFTYELARRLNGTKVTVNAANPGMVSSNFALEGAGIVSIFKPFLNLFGVSPRVGAETIVDLAASPAVKTLTGKYFQKGHATRSSRASYDLLSARKLWEVSEKMTDLADSNAAI